MYIRDCHSGLDLPGGRQVPVGRDLSLFSSYFSLKKSKQKNAASARFVTCIERHRSGKTADRNVFIFLNTE